MKHEVTLQFTSLAKLKHFVETIKLRNFKLDGHTITCTLTFQEVEIAKQYGGWESIEAR